MTQKPAERSVDPVSALAEAVALLGGQAATARLLNIAQPSVWRWIKLGRPLPPEHVLKVEEATGISRHDLRPDIYGATAATAPTLESPTAPEPAR